MQNIHPEGSIPQAAPHLVEAMALPNDTAADALDRVNRASVGSLRATSSQAYLKGLEKHVAAWLGRIQDRCAEEVAA